MLVMADPFAILGVKPQFDLDAEGLHARFIAAVATAHPDRFSDPVDQADAAVRTAEINEAYATLTDPERRANALLIKLGGPAKNDDKSLPPDLLMQMMEVREQSEQAIATDNRTELERLRCWARNQREEYLGRISKLFERRDTTAIRMELNALRYIEQMLKQLPH